MNLWHSIIRCSIVSFLPANADGNNNATWAVNLRSTDFKLLCPNNGAADVFDYNTCHLARVPAHKVGTEEEGQ